MSRVRPPWTSSPLQVWAIEDRSIQVTWGNLPSGPVRATAHPVGVVPRVGVAPLAEMLVEHAGGPGVLDLVDLPAATALTIEIVWRGGSRSLECRTSTPPPGAELFRFATVSDLHIGATTWGFLKTMTERDASPDDDPYPIRCARAAIAESVAWGARLLVIKGDLVQHRDPDDFARAGALLDEFAELPMLLLPGNHDVDLTHSQIDLPTLGRRGLSYRTGPTGHDVPGLRILTTDSTIPGQGHGTLGSSGVDLVDLAHDAGRPIFLALHHHFHRYDVVTHWPPGIPKSEADEFFPALRRANPTALVSSGHSHRNRRTVHHGIPFAEVASTKDWPGVWAGYVVHEGGIRQVVRKVHATVDWHEYSRGAVLGAWGLWAPGRPEERSFVIDWSSR